MSRLRICIITYSQISHDARVLRQIRFLAPHYALTVVGFGAPPPELATAADWVQITPDSEATGGARLRNRLSNLLLVSRAGTLTPRAYELWSATSATNRAALAALRGRAFDAVHVNDWDGFWVGARIAAATRAKLVFDIHEFAPLEWEEDRWWRWCYKPLIIYLLQTYATRADKTITVCAPIAERYRSEFGFAPIVVLNAPERGTAPDHAVDPANVRLIHHGGAIRSRAIERMVEAVAQADPRFSLDLMLLDNPRYIEELRQLAARRAPERIRVIAPVKPHEIVDTIAAYDIGLYLMKPSNYNNAVALPNKLFDFINAGLAVCVGPSPAMAGLVREYQLGTVADSFAPESLAALLNALTVEQLTAMRAGSRAAAHILNAEHEMAKVTGLYRDLLGA